MDQAPPLLRRSLRNRDRLKGPKRLNLKASTAKQSCYRALQLLAASGILLLSNNPVQALDTPAPSMVDHCFDQSLAPSFPEYNWGATQMDQMNYIHGVDLLSEEPDSDWEPLHVLKHKVSRRKGVRSVKVQVQWKSLRKSWVDLQAVRAQSPVVLMEYANRMNLPIIPSNPDWYWIKQYKQCPKTMSKVIQAYQTSRKQDSRVKFGITVPHSVRHALLLDALNGDNLWREAIDKEMKQINEYKTFRVMPRDFDYSAYQRIPCHFVFDVKFDLRRKARLVAGGTTLKFLLKTFTLVLLAWRLYVLVSRLPISMDTRCVLLMLAMLFSMPEIKRKYM